MTYTVRGSAGRRQVVFACPRCNATLESPLAEAGDVYPCPTCGQDFTTPGSDDLRREQQVASRDAGQRAKELAAGGPSTTAARLAAGEVPQDVGDIIRTNPLILAAFALGVIWPIGVFLVPLTGWRLLRALHVEGNTRRLWLLGCAVPLLGLLILKKIVDKAAAVVDGHRPALIPLNATEEAEYKQLVNRGRAGHGLAGLFVLDRIIFGAGHSIFGIGIALVWLVIEVTITIKKRPYLRKLRDHGYVKLWFATSNPIEDFNKKVAAT